MMQPVLPGQKRPLLLSANKKASLSAKPQMATQSPVRFGGLAEQVPPKIGKALQKLDFKDLGSSHVTQIQLVYALCIGWRLLAANDRRLHSDSKSWSEVRENAIRDPIGYGFWFFGVPMLQRGYLRFMVPKEMRENLYQAANIKETGIMGSLKKWNPITGALIPTSQQVNDLKTQHLKNLEATGIKPNSSNYLRGAKHFDQLIKHRNIATGLGLLSTIGLLGIGINLFNFYLTERSKKAREREAIMPTFPAAPPIPTFRPVQPSPVAPATPASPPRFQAAFPLSRQTPFANNGQPVR